MMVLTFTSIGIHMTAYRQAYIDYIYEYNIIYIIYMYTDLHIR